MTSGGVSGISCNARVRVITCSLRALQTRSSHSLHYTLATPTRPYFSRDDRVTSPPPFLSRLSSVSITPPPPSLRPSVDPRSRRILPFHRLFSLSHSSRLSIPFTNLPPPPFWPVSITPLHTSTPQHPSPPRYAWTLPIGPGAVHAQGLLPLDLGYRPRIQCLEHCVRVQELHVAPATDLWDLAIPSHPALLLLPNTHHLDLAPHPPVLPPLAHLLPARRTSLGHVRGGPTRSVDPRLGRRFRRQLARRRPIDHERHVRQAQTRATRGQGGR